MTSLREALAAGRATLERSGVESAALDARLLLAAASGRDMAALIAGSTETLGPIAAATLDAHLARRADGEPVARILGEAEFWSLKFRLNAATLVPRPDTETLVTTVLQAIRDRKQTRVSILDLGTGSGAIVIALLKELPEATAVATDISEEALAAARFNAERHGVLFRLRLEKVGFEDGPEGRFDIVVSNPPYVRTGAIETLAREVRDHDPRLALDGGADGLAAYRAILARADSLLLERGFIALEVGYDQSDSVTMLCEERGLTDVRVHRDLAGIERVVSAGFAARNVNPAGAKKALGKVG